MSGPSILLVEDNPDDVLLVQRAFRKGNLQANLQLAGDGEQAISFLSDAEAGSRPELILLDLKLPRASGLEVLDWLRSRSGLRRIPVVVLTSSRENRDVNSAYDLGANSYLIKPVQFDALLDMLKKLHLYWLVLNQRPDTETAALD